MTTNHSDMLNKPPRSLGLAVSAVLVVVWLAIRLGVFQTLVFPLTYAIPLLIGVWTRDRLAVWTMALLFVIGHAIKQFWILPAGALTPAEDWATFLATVLNLGAGALIVHLIINLRDRLDRLLGDLRTANEQVRAQAGELEQQNEELAQQSEEVEQQSEELAEQNEELQAQAETIGALNTELSHRGALLESLLDAARLQTAEGRALEDVCLAVMGGTVWNISGITRDKLCGIEHISN